LKQELSLLRGKPRRLDDSSPLRLPQDGDQENVLPGGRYPLPLVDDEAGTV
jgi:hypothetical protein